MINSKAVIYGAAGQLTGSTITGNALVAGTTITGSGAVTAQKFRFEGTNDSGVACLYSLNVQGGMLVLTSGSL